MYYPRSLPKFIFLGFILVSAPLIYALIELNGALNQLTQQSRESVFTSAAAARLSRQFVEQANILERLARQYTILEDGALLEDYAAVRQVLLVTQTQLAASLSKEGHETLQGAVDDEATLFSTLQRYKSMPENAMSIDDICRRFVANAQTLQSVADEQAQKSVAQLQQTADEGSQRWQWLLWAALVIAVLLAVLLAFLIARPIHRIDQAIRQLGSADFSKEIEVNGPADLRYLGQRLEWLRTRLQTLEEQQTRFLRNLSHELKTPLTAIREGTELLRDGVGGSLKDEQREILHIVRENTLSLQRMIEDLLMYHQSRVMEPALQLPVDLSDVVRHVVREHRLAAWGRLISFEERLLPLLVNGDQKKIVTIVDNLVSNAIKYSPRLGKIYLVLKADGDCAQLDVVDEGPGVPASEREHIFETFYQGTAPAESSVKGSGLGLTISREYVLAHGGRIVARERSDGRAGARLTLWLPFWMNTVSLPPETAA